MSGIIGGICAGCASAIACACCASVGSVCSSCFGNDKPSTDAPSVKSGRKRSVFLLALAIAIMLVFQYGLAPKLSEESSVSKLPFAGQYLVDTWSSGCDGLGTDELRANCSGNNGVYRVASVTVLFYFFAGITVYCIPSHNREVWPAKLFLFVAALIVTVFISNAPVFSAVYPQIGRIGGVLFVVLQQLILLDLSYNLNESLVARADEAESIEIGSGQKWLTMILVTCAVLYTSSIVVIGVMFHFYSGCSTNEAFISITLILSIIMTAVQMSGEEASLLTSAFLTAYATFLCVTAVTKNPNEECNPFLKKKDALGITLGLVVTFISLAWAGWSNTASRRLLDDVDDSDEYGAGYTPPVAPSDGKIKGVAVSADNEEEDNNYGSTSSGNNTPSHTTSTATAVSSAGWKINAVLLLVTCWISMSLTGWSSVVGGGDLANPSVHNVSMWMIIASQWVMMLMYLWTLVAPRLFPDRDFS